MQESVKWADNEYFKRKKNLRLTNFKCLSRVKVYSITYCDFLNSCFVWRAVNVLTRPGAKNPATPLLKLFLKPMVYFMIISASLPER